MHPIVKTGAFATLKISGRPLMGTISIGIMVASTHKARLILEDVSA